MFLDTSTILIVRNSVWKAAQGSSTCRRSHPSAINAFKIYRLLFSTSSLLILKSQLKTYADLLDIDTPPGHFAWNTMVNIWLTWFVIIWNRWDLLLKTGNRNVDSEKVKCITVIGFVSYARKQQWKTQIEEKTSNITFFVFVFVFIWCRRCLSCWTCFLRLFLQHTHVNIYDDCADDTRRNTG